MYGSDDETILYNCGPRAAIDQYYLGHLGPKWKLARLKLAIRDVHVNISLKTWEGQRHFSIYGQSPAQALERWRCLHTVSLRPRRLGA